MGKPPEQLAGTATMRRSPSGHGKRSASVAARAEPLEQVGPRTEEIEASAHA